jgi:hypothetical protein
MTFNSIKDFKNALGKAFDAAEDLQEVKIKRGRRYYSLRLVPKDFEPFEDKPNISQPYWEVK